ncbi:MAG: hypothetical protein M3Z32_13930 [Acidobacteriota bacterium]|nr:hypothetical protein [Acidobacteriota bacterium]
MSVGMSLKVPTGTFNATGRATDSKGQTILATADQSIQAGDGGTGFTIDLQGYKPSYRNTELYFAGVYLFNSRNTNGISSFRRLPGEQVLSSFRSISLSWRYRTRGAEGSGSGREHWRTNGRRTGP